MGILAEISVSVFLPDRSSFRGNPKYSYKLDSVLFDENHHKPIYIFNTVVLRRIEVSYTVFVQK